MWQLLPAMTIVALALFNTFRHEDPIAGQPRLAETIRDMSVAPICASEAGSLSGICVAGVVMLDIAGAAASRKIAAMAEAWHLPIAPHDRIGPVVR